MINRKIVENIKYIKCLGNLITSDATCPDEIQVSGRPRRKHHSTIRTLFFASKLDVNLIRKLINCYIWNVPFYGAKILNSLESRLEINLKFWNMVLEKDG
jgi:hypothetical protein